MNMKEIYFDNSATTKISERVKNAVISSMVTYWGNPSSVHDKGICAEKAMSSAREKIIRAMGIRSMNSGRLIFTGSGTESDNLAIMGTLFSKNFRFNPRIVITDSEHPAVENTVKEAEKKGLDVVRLSTRKGIIDFDEVYSALTKETVLVSVMRVNNETGAIYDVEKIFEIAKEKCPDAVTHCDAVQGFMKINCNPLKIKADLVTLSGHKIGGPKGIGALWCNNELLLHKRLKPMIFGGGQEGSIRSGTENSLGIIGMGEAAEERAETVLKDWDKITALRGRLLEGLPGFVSVNQPEGEYLPNIISICVHGIKSEVLVRYMSSLGIYISAGSACSSKKLKASRVLTAFGLSPDSADSTVRVSISADNTEHEIDEFISALVQASSKLANKYH